MSGLRQRLETHRHDALLLLREITHTATAHAGFRLAGAVGHIARAQELLAEELRGLPEVCKDSASSQECGEPSVDLEETPADGIRLVKRKPAPGHSDWENQ